MSRDDLRARARAYSERARPPRRTPPEDTAEPLGVLVRQRQGQRVEVRIGWATFEGRPYVQIREWMIDAHGQAWPGKAGCSIRLGELGDAVEALLDAMDRADAHRRGGR